MLTLKTPLKDLYGVGPRFLSRLNHLGLKTVRDLLWHFPFRYDDYSVITKVADLAEGEKTTIRAEIRGVNIRQSFKKRMVIIEAMLADETGSIKAAWFNQPYLKNILAEGKIFNFSGKIGAYGGEMVITSPTYEAATTESKHTARLVPIYPETRGISSKGIRAINKPILDNLPEINEVLPDFVLDENELPDINEALRTIHYPNRIEEAEAARKRFAFNELFFLMILHLKRKETLKDEKTIAIKPPIKYVKEIIDGLPFTLTKGQEEAIKEILKELEQNHPMNRILQGDVGSGKTLVAAVAMAVTAKEGKQAALLAPTEVLARQHYEYITGLFKDTGLVIGFLSGGEKPRLFFGDQLETDFKKPEFKDKTARGEIDIVIGTHALIQKDVEFDKLALVVVDEQHRFGVEQRAALSKTSNKNKKITPHFLSMSATPIPRTLMLTVFGDLEASVLKELPGGRKKIKTYLVPKEKREGAYDFTRKEVEAGRQVFVICPRVMPPEDKMMGQKELFALELKSVKEEYERLQTKIWPDLRVAMLHGKMRSKDKEKTMRDFKDKKFDILVATAVIEVGVDVPNASVMIIEDADRFGLAQLHQFRGRVGRGDYQSYCLLFTENKSMETRGRLKALLTAKDGFELAEQDLKLRGPGQFLGKQQTGTPDIAMRSLHDMEIIKGARRSAEKLIKEDKDFKKYPLLREEIEIFTENIHWE